MWPSGVSFQVPAALHEARPVNAVAPNEPFLSKRQDIGASSVRCSPTDLLLRRTSRIEGFSSSSARHGRTPTTPEITITHTTKKRLFTRETMRTPPEVRSCRHLFLGGRSRFLVGMSPSAMSRHRNAVAHSICGPSRYRKQVCDVTQPRHTVRRGPSAAVWSEMTRSTPAQLQVRYTLAMAPPLAHSWYRSSHAAASNSVVVTNATMN